MASTQSNGHHHQLVVQQHYDHHHHGYGGSFSQLPHVLHDENHSSSAGGAHRVHAYNMQKQVHVDVQRDNAAACSTILMGAPAHVDAGNYGHACILAIARAVPPHKLMQHSYADFYFNITNCQHMTQLKLKMQRICERSGVETRHSIMTEEFLKEHPELYTPGTPSLEERQRLLAEEVPRLAAQAAEAALREWGRPAHHITHLVVVTLSGVAMPGADVRLVQLLGLRPCVRRVMLYMLGCYAGVTALRVAKDLAENNPGSRVLVCCSELSATTFRAPQESSPYNLVSAALFGDGAVALVVGAHPITAPPTNTGATPPCEAAMAISSPLAVINGLPSQCNGKPLDTYSRKLHEKNHTHGALKGFTQELHASNQISHDTNPSPLPSFISTMSLHPPRSLLRLFVPIPPQQSLDATLTFEHPIYEIHTAIETIIPGTENIIQGSMKVEGLEFYLDRALPSLVSDHVASFCKDLIKVIPGESMSLQEVFWAVHPGGPAVLDAVEQAAKLDSHHLQASRHILSKYGNVSASTVLFVLDELRKSKSLPPSPEWGVAIAFGPGITFEGVLLRRVSCN